MAWPIARVDSIPASLDLRVAGLGGNLQLCRRAGIFRINALITDDISARRDTVRANLDVPT